MYMWGILDQRHISYCLCPCVLVAQSCLTLCDPIDCSPPGSSVHGILQARLLEWVPMPSSRESSPPRDQTQVSLIAGRFFCLSHQGSHWNNVVKIPSVSSMKIHKWGEKNNLCLHRGRKGRRKIFVSWWRYRKTSGFSLKTFEMKYTSQSQ